MHKHIVTNCTNFRRTPLPRCRRSGAGTVLAPAGEGAREAANMIGADESAPDTGDRVGHRVVAAARRAAPLVGQGLLLLLGAAAQFLALWLLAG
jgi:hypothetical protein